MVGSPPNRGEEFLDRPAFPLQAMGIAMKNRILLTLSTLAAPVLFISCSTPSASPTYEDVVSKLQEETKDAVFPRVVSPGWRVLGNGTPEMDVSGVSRVSYVKNGAPDDVVEIFYHGQKNSRITADDKSSVTVMGQKVQTYGSGNEIVAFATQPILLTAPNGKSAYYTFQFNNEHLYKTRDIPQFGW